jgi:hypothetical protein
MLPEAEIIDAFKFQIEVLSKGKNPWKESVDAIFKLAGTIFISLKKRNKSSLNKHIAIVSTVNNFRALEFLNKHLNNVQFVSLNRKLRISDSIIIAPIIINNVIIKDFLLTFLVLFVNFGWKTLTQVDIILKSCSIRQYLLSTFENNSNRIVYFSNDHSPTMRVAARTCAELGFVTIYIQHASVGFDFPPLIFSLSLLEGQDAKTKYEKAGIHGSVKFIGMPKSDSYVNVRKSRRTLKSIGLGISVLDNYSKVCSLVEFLQSHFPKIQIIFRQHPRDNRKFSLHENVAISAPLNESSFEFLLRCDVLVAGVTSMHLEATMLNIPAIYYDLEGFYYDYYGYSKRHLCYTASNLQQLKKLITDFQREIPKVYERAKFYNETIGTTYEGQSQTLAIQYIKEHIIKVGQAP